MQQKQISILVTLFLLGLILLNYPIINLINADTLIFGIPALLVYFFGVIVVLITFIFLASRNKPIS